MLNYSFSHIPSVGATTEMNLWLSDIRTMDDFLSVDKKVVSPGKRKHIESHILLAKEKLKVRDAAYFYRGLPSKEHWRIYEEFRNETVYLDIETTGLTPTSDIITTIAMFDGRNTYYYVNGQNLDDFKLDIMRYKVIVSFNGKCFDAPFIEKFFKISLPHAHIDLRYVLASLGYKGGLKYIEPRFGIKRDEALDGVDGFFAVYLWEDYKKNKNNKALETLLSYNIEDVLNLEYLMVKAYNTKLDNIPFRLKPIALPSKSGNPFNPDVDTINRLKSQIYGCFADPNGFALRRF